MKQSKVKQELQDNQGINARAQIIHNNSRAFRQPFEAAHRRRFHNIEYTKKYKAGEQRLPCDGTGNQRHQLSGNFVNHHMRRVFPATAARFQRGCRNSYSYHADDQQQNYRYSRRRW